MTTMHINGEPLTSDQLRKIQQAIHVFEWVGCPVESMDWRFFYYFTVKEPKTPVEMLAIAGFTMRPETVH